MTTTIATYTFEHIDKSISLVESSVIHASSMGSNSEDENGVDKKPSSDCAVKHFNWKPNAMPLN